jgi:Xaa-Pro aminopeptidase
MGLNTANRLARLRQKLTEKELDGIFVSQPENRFYLSGFAGSAGYLVITAKDAILATDFRYIEQSKAQAPDYQIFQITGKLEEWFPRLTGGLNTKRLGFESGDVTFAFHHQLTDIPGQARSTLQLIPVEGLVESIRTIKEPEEMALIAQAAGISDSAFVHVIGKIHIGMTEKEVAWEIEKFMREHDSQSVPFEPIVAAGPNSALPHARPSLRPIKAGEPVVIDIGARVGGYASDLTRTICLGKPDDTFKKVYDTVLGAQLAALALIKEGMTGEMADSLARTVIKEAGYAEAFGHALGHGVGLAPHEPPRLGPNSTEVLTSGMVFTVEPGIYLPGWGGVRIEDLVVMENGQLKVLSRAPKTDPDIIGAT